MIKYNEPLFKVTTYMVDEDVLTTSNNFDLNDLTEYDANNIFSLYDANNIFSL
jgi:hypothetical protein